MDKHKKRRSFASLTALAMAALIFVSPAHADPVTDDQVQQAKNAETQTANDIASLEVQLATLSAQSNDLDMKVAEAQAKKIQADAAVNKAMDDLTAAEDAFLNAAAASEAARKQLAQVSNEIYQEGVGSIASANYLFGAESLAEANDRARAYQMLGHNTDKQVQQYEALQAVADSLQTEMNKTVDGYVKAADDATAAATAVTQAQADVESQKASLAGQRSDLIVKLAAQKGTTADLEAQAQDQKDAQAKAEAAAARQKVIDDAKASAPTSTSHGNGATGGGGSSSGGSSNGGGSTGGGSSNGGGSTGGTVPQPTPTKTTPAPAPTTTKPAPAPEPTTEAPKPAPTTAPPAPEPEPTYPSVGGGTPEVIAIAKQYIGYPYVWGTGGPNTFDCAGFTKYVYAKLGISLPFSSSGQRWVGTQVSASQALPGDLMWWPGHVAIYMGNGQNIGAWNPDWGVRIGQNSWINADKGQPVFLRLR